MRGRAWQITRAGLFLLFAVVLAALGPTDAALANNVGCAATSEHKPDTKEQRDDEQLRERLPGLTHRRSQLRHEHDRDALRGAAQWAAEDSEILVRSPVLPNVETDAREDRGRLRHSPPNLQVMRN